MAMMLISGCVTGGQKTEPATVTIDTACDWVVPIYVTSNDVNVMNTKTKAAILSHNESWQKVCGGLI